MSEDRAESNHEEFMQNAPERNSENADLHHALGLVPNDPRALKVLQGLMNSGQ